MENFVINLGCYFIGQFFPPVGGEGLGLNEMNRILAGWK